MYSFSPSKSTPRIAAKIGKKFIKSPALDAPTSSTPLIKNTCARKDGTKAIYSIVIQAVRVRGSCIPTR